MVPPDPMPNSEVKRRSADGSVGSPHARVGNCQASNKTKGSVERLGLLESLLVTLSGTVPDIDVESITVIGEGEGSATQIASLLEKLKQTTGIDLAKSLPGQSDSPAAKS